MPSHPRFEGDAPLRFRFAVSPLWELQEAVRTLRTPARHGYHLPWLRRIRDAAAGLDLSPLWLLTPEDGHRPDFLSPPPTGAVTAVEEELARVRGADPDRAREELARSLARTSGAADSPYGRALLGDPAHSVRALADLLELTWKALLAPYWPRLRTLLEADIAFRTRRLAEGGPKGLFEDLHPRPPWADGALAVGPGGAERVHAPGADSLTLVPSVFGRPDGASRVAPPWRATVVYPAHGAGGMWHEPAGAPAEALTVLLGRGRAAVLSALAEPATTTALAGRLGLAPSSVSAHLSALRGAGLLVSNRRGHQVLYERTPLGIALAAGRGEG